MGPADLTGRALSSRRFGWNGSGFGGGGGDGGSGVIKPTFTGRYLNTIKDETTSLRGTGVDHCDPSDKVSVVVGMTRKGCCEEREKIEMEGGRGNFLCTIYEERNRIRKERKKRKNEQ